LAAENDAIPNVRQSIGAGEKPPVWGFFKRCPCDKFQNEAIVPILWFPFLIQDFIPMGNLS